MSASKRILLVSCSFTMVLILGCFFALGFLRQDQAPVAEIGKPPAISVPVVAKTAAAGTSPSQTSGVSGREAGEFGAIGGRILTRDGRPAVGASVIILPAIEVAEYRGENGGDSRPREVEADSEGLFLQDSLWYGRYTVLGTQGDQGAVADAAITEAEPRVEVKLVLQSGGQVAGTVVNEKDEPIEGARVVAVARKKYPMPVSLSLALTQRSGSAGEFSFPFLVEGPWQFAVAAPEYLATMTDHVPVGTVDLHIRMARGATLSGRVLHSQSDRGVSGMQIRVRSDLEDLRPTLIGLAPSALTQDDGSFLVAGLNEGAYYLSGEHDVYVLTEPGKRVEVGAATDQPLLVLRAIPGSVVHGRVVRVGGEGVSGHRVGIWNQNFGKNVRTDESGRYQFKNVPPGVHTLSFEATMTPQVQPPKVQVEPETDVEVPDWVVGGRTALLEGMVVDDERSPVSGALVRVSGPLRLGAYSGSGGKFAIQFEPHMLKGRVAVSAWSLTAGSKPIELEISPGGVSGIELVLDSPIGVIAGQVLDTQRRPKAASVIVKSSALDESSESVSTDADGYFVATVQTPADYSLFLAPFNPIKAEGYGRVFASELKLSAGESKTGLRLVYDDSSLTQIAGKVVDYDGVAIAGARVTMRKTARESETGVPEFASTTSDLEGNFTLADLSGELFDLEADHVRYRNANVNGVPAGADHVRIILDRLWQVSGHVVDAGTKRPLVSFEAALHPSGEVGWEPYYTFHLFANAEGYFVIEEPREPMPGGATLSVRSMGYQTLHADLGVLNESNADDHKFELEPMPGVRLRGRVIDDGSGPIAGAMIFPSQIGLERVPVGQWYAESDVEGNFILEYLPPDVSEITVERNGYATGSWAVEPGVEEVGDLVLFASGSVGGVVTLDGQPVPGAFITVSGLRRGIFQTGAGGEFRIDNLPPGIASLRVQAEPTGDVDHPEVRTLEVEITSGSHVTLDLEISSGESEPVQSGSE